MLTALGSLRGELKLNSKAGNFSGSTRDNYKMQTTIVM